MIFCRVASSSIGERERLGSTSNYYNYFEDANSFVVQKAQLVANAAASQSASNNPILRNLALMSTSQSSQPHTQSQSRNVPIITDYRDLSNTNITMRDQQHNSINTTGRLISDLSQNEIDTSFEYLNRLNVRCSSVPLLAIYIKNEPDSPENDELNLNEKETRFQSSEKELMTFIDFLNDDSKSKEKEEQNDQSTVDQSQQQNKTNDEDIKLEKLDSEEDGYADVEESISEIMNFSNRQQTIIKRDQRDHIVEMIKDDEQDDNLVSLENQMIEKENKNDFLIDSHHHRQMFDEFDEKENRSPITDDDDVDGGLEFEDNEEELDDGEHIQLLPSTPSTYSLFQKLMNKHSSCKEGGNSNQNTLKKQHSSDIECQNRSNSLVNYNTISSDYKHHHRRKKNDDSLVILDGLDDQSNQQQINSAKKTINDNTSDELYRSSSNAKISYKKHSDSTDKRTRQSKKIKDKQTGGHRNKYRTVDIWSEMPNSSESQQQNRSYHQQIELIKNEHIQMSNNLTSSRSMQLSQTNSYDQSTDPNSLNVTTDQQNQLNMRSNSKDSIKSPKLEKKKRKFSKKALHLLRVSHFRKSKSEETGKELESLGLASKTLAAVCKARSYNYNLIKNMNEYNLSQQSSVFNSANNSYEENYHIINSSYYNDQQSMPSHQYNVQNVQQHQQQQFQQNNSNQQCSHNQFNQISNQQQSFNKSSFAHPLHQQTNVYHSNAINKSVPFYNQSSNVASNFLDNQQTNQSLMNNDQIINDDRLFAVHIHHTDRKLKSSKGIVNPLVKLHVVNIHTGEYLQTSEFAYQSQLGENAGLYCGSMENKLYVHPITTQPCDLLFKFRYPKNPTWQELLILNESYNFLKYQNDVILFFEVCIFSKKIRMK